MKRTGKSVGSLPVAVAAGVLAGAILPGWLVAAAFVAGIIAVGIYVYRA